MNIIKKYIKLMFLRLVTMLEQIFKRKASECIS